MRNRMRVLAGVLTTGIVLSSMGSVLAQSHTITDISARFGINRPGFGFGSNPGGNQGWDNDQDNYGHGETRERSFRETEYIGQEVSFGDKVFLGKAFNLHKDHKDQEVDTIEVTIQGLQHGGVAMLLVNGEKMGQVKEFQGRHSGDRKLKWTLYNGPHCLDHF